MPEFLDLLPPEQALNIFLENLSLQPKLEKVETIEALGRVTAGSIFSPHHLPEFPRSTVDGYALLAKNTYGVSGSLPAYLELIDEVPMGAAPEFSLSSGQCALIHTGGMLPEGADAVVMVEDTQTSRHNEVEVLRALAVGDNTLEIGEDVARGEEIIKAGTLLRPAEIGGLMALGITEVGVSRKPVTAILSSGDEVIPPFKDPKPGQVRDVNAYTLSSLVAKAGGAAILYGIIPDEKEAMFQAVEQALAECDIIVVTAGSSVSTRDLTAVVFNSFGNPGVLVHGVNVRPGKPTILAVCQGKALIGLPGNPVSALLIARIFIVPIIEALLGIELKRIAPRIPARLGLNLASLAGREDWIPVVLSKDADGYRADPVFGKSNLIFTLSKADGIIRIPPDATGLEVGEYVEVFLLD